MRVLVTGVAGFVGPHLVRALHAAGHEVHGSTLPGEDRSALRDMTLSLHEADVADGAGLERLLATTRPGGVIHLAAVSFVPTAAGDPQLAYRVNVGGTVALLGALRAAAPTARLLFVGSSDAYGAVRPTELPVGEDVPLRPLSVYGATKAAAEIAVAQWGRSEGLDVVMARPFNHTGPGQSADFVCPALARQIVAIEAGTQKPVLRVGNVDPVRDIGDVRDVVRAYVALLDRGTSGRVYNVCSGEGVSIAEVIALLRSHARVPMRAHSDPARRRAVEIPRVVGSHARITEDTGWLPERPLTQTLCDVLDDWRHRSA
jgi:GDP-4-dehydro-6-deoxy-D-mannose reductase